MYVVKELDPEGVLSRRKKRLRRRCYSVPGPDFLWNIDGYDKLKPYGVSRHGCIHGFSLQIIWLKVAPSNKNPSTIASYYYSAVREMGGVPTRIRSDDMENSIIETIQIFVRSAHDDEFAGIESFLKGTSPANQRIESFWSQLAKDRPMWWRQFSGKLSSLGFVDGSSLIVQECLQFCFMGSLREELNEFKNCWNCHLIATSHGSTLPRGRPYSLYCLPELYEGESFRKDVDLEELEEFNDPAFIRETDDISVDDISVDDISDDDISDDDISDDFKEFASIVLETGETANYPQSVDEGLHLYFILLEAIATYS